MTWLYRKSWSGYYFNTMEKPSIPS